MVLDLLTLTAIPTVVGASEAVHQQGILDEDAESEERQAPFYLDVFCDAQSRKREEVHNTTVVLKDGKVDDPFLLNTNKPLMNVLLAMVMAQRRPQRPHPRRTGR